jgi:hypothetical protein
MFNARMARVAAGPEGGAQIRVDRLNVFTPVGNPVVRRSTNAFFGAHDCAQARWFLPLRTKPRKKFLNNLLSPASKSSAVMTDSSRPMLIVEGTALRVAGELPPAWREFIRFCTDLRHGELERLSIQDGLPVFAEITKKKVKFHGRSQQGAAP